MAACGLNFTLAVLCLAVLYIHLYDCSVSQPADVDSCNSDNITIGWNYADPADMATVVWEYIDTSNTVHTIMLQSQGNAAIPQAGYDVVHISNGKITIYNVDTADSGTYKITVSYATSIPTAADEVSVNIFEPPSGLGSTETIMGCNATYTCTAADLGGPVPATLHIVVGGQKQSTASASVTKNCDRVQCTFDGAVASACLGSTYVNVLTKFEIQCTDCEVCVGICSAGLAAVAVGLVVLCIAVFACQGDPGSGIHRVVARSLQLIHVFGVLTAIATSLYCLAVGIAGVAALHTGCEDCGCECGCDCCIYDQEDCDICKSISIACIIVAFIGLIVTIATVIYKSQGFYGKDSAGGDGLGHGSPDGGPTNTGIKMKPKESHEMIPAAQHREDTSSAGAVSRQDVLLERRPMPAIPSHNRGLSANMEDPNRLPDVDRELPRDGRSKKLEPLDSDRDNPEKKKKKKKKKKDSEWSENENTGLNF